MLVWCRTTFMMHSPRITSTPSRRFPLLCSATAAASCPCPVPFVMNLPLLLSHCNGQSLDWLLLMLGEGCPGLGFQSLGPGMDLFCFCRAFAPYGFQAHFLRSGQSTEVRVFLLRSSQFYRGWPRCRLHSPRAERMTEKTA